MSERVQRRQERTEVNWIAVIRLADGSDHPCTIKDVSTTGLKICAAEDLALPEMFMIKVVGRQLVFRVKQAWRRNHYIGVIIEKIAKLPEPPSAPADDRDRASAQAEAHARLGSRRRYEAGS